MTFFRNTYITGKNEFVRMNDKGRSVSTT
jgi:hypothetical protein